MQQNKSKVKNILMIVDGYYPADIRVRKEAESLATEYNVFVLCCKKENEAPEEVIEKVTVLRKIKYKNFTEKGLVDIQLAVNFIHPKFKKWLSVVILEHNIDILHVHDLPLAKTGYIFTKKHNLISILDLHENYAAALLTWFSWRKNPIIRVKNRLFFSYKRWQNYENHIITKYDKIIAVVEEMEKRIVSDTSLDQHKITVITNSEKKEFADNFSANNNSFFVDYKNRFIVSYVGGFGPHRGLQTAIEGIKEVVKEVPNVLLVLVGPANRDVKAHLEGLIKKFNVEDNVVILGRQPFKNVLQIMKSSDVNTIPHISNMHTESTIPHKLYQILLSKKPLLVSNCKPLQRVVKENKVGAVFNAGNPKSFANEVIKIYKNYSEAEEKANHGFDLAYNGTLNWEFTQKKLLHLYDNLSS